MMETKMVPCGLAPTTKGGGEERGTGQSWSPSLRPEPKGTRQGRGRGGREREAAGRDFCDERRHWAATPKVSSWAHVVSDKQPLQLDPQGRVPNCTGAHTLRACIANGLETVTYY